MPAVSWPPQIDEPLPRSEIAFGIRSKLVAYSLAPDHPAGGPKARGFAVVLGITAEDVDHLVAEIEANLSACRVSAIRANPPYGYLCEVRVPVRGLGDLRERRVEVVTSWELLADGAAPRLVTAYIKG
jgi:hypothetical protein